MVLHPAALDLPHALVEWVTMLIVTREGDRRCKLPPHQRARSDPDYLLLDGTPAECDRLGDGRADYSHKHRRYGANVQIIAAPTGQVLWISPAQPGRTHDLTAARDHRIIRICERQGVPVLADRAYQGDGP